MGSGHAFAESTLRRHSPHRQPSRSAISALEMSPRLGSDPRFRIFRVTPCAASLHFVLQKAAVMIFSGGIDTAQWRQIRIGLAASLASAAAAFLLLSLHLVEQYLLAQRCLGA